MGKKKLLVMLFMLVALAQLYVPAKMILDIQDILATGKEYKFRTAPVDPNDPFRGKYITLHYKENTVHIQNPDNWTGNEIVYVLLSTNKDGYAMIHSVSKVRPVSSKDFLEAKVNYVSDNKNLIIDYPFDRYYMEEFKAHDAERVYLKSLSDTNKVTYALVNIKEGKAVLKDVVINGISIKEIVTVQKRDRK